MIRAVLRLLVAFSLLFVFACGAPAPPPVAAPATPPPPPPATARAAEERVIGTVRVTASALNVRREATTDGDVITQVRRGTTLSVLANDDSWTKVRLANGEVGWVASRFVSSDTATARRTSGGRAGCPPDSDYAFIDTPTPSFSDSGAHGIVVVEANVNTKGVVTSTKIVSNTTGDESLAFLAQREIKGARFSPPIRNCVPRAFIFTYRRTF